MRLGARREVQVAKGPWDPMAAVAAFHGGLLASDADRDRMLDVVATVFAQGWLTEDERLRRTDQVLAARTQGELVAIATALAALQPAPPALAPTPRRVVKKIAAGGLCVLMLLPLLSIAFRTYDGGLLILFLLTFLGSAAVAVRRPASRRRR